MSLQTAAASTLDRDYRLGDDQYEFAAVGSPVGDPTYGLTFDSWGLPLTGDLNDLTPMNGPVYANVTGRPMLAGSGIGVSFDGVNDYLVGANLNWPQESVASINYDDEGGNPLPGPLNYNGLVDRWLQFWVRADASGLGNGQAQDLVMDSNEHGARISETDTWVMRYNKNDYDSGVPVDTGWHHVMVARPSGPSGASGGSRMWVDGIGVAAFSGPDYSASRLELVVGANTSRDEFGSFNGGTTNFFKGTIDDLQLAVIGDNTGNAGPPPGKDWGDFDFAAENQYAAGTLNSVAGDLDQNGVLNQADKDAFIAGWMTERLVMGFRTGDLTSLENGDLTFDGITDIDDLVLMQNALAAAGMAAISAGELGGVPEPATAALAVILAALGPLMRRGSNETGSVGGRRRQGQ